MSDGYPSGGFRRSRTYYGIPSKRSYTCRSQFANHRPSTGNCRRCSREHVERQAYVTSSSSYSGSSLTASATAPAVRIDDDGNTSCSSAEDCALMSQLFASDNSESPSADSEEDRRHQLTRVGRTDNGNVSSSMAESECRGEQLRCLADPPANLQVTKRSLAERVSSMFLSETLADVHFWVGSPENRQRVPAHKFILCVGSSVFNAMFTGSMGPCENEDIEIPDIEYPVFLAFLKFLYSDQVDVDAENATALLYAAKKYAVRGLEIACVEYLIQQLSPDNALMLLSHARLFDEKMLSDVCLEVIDSYTNDALNSDSFLDVDVETLGSVLKRDTLRVREVSLFLAILRWSAEQCRKRGLEVTPENQRGLLSPLLPAVRFPLMAVDEFAQHVAQSGILTDKELINLFIYFTSKLKPEVPFSDTPRCTTVEQVVNRFQRIEDRWGYNGAPDKIKFTVNRKIYLVGFGLYGSIHGPTEYLVKIQLINGVNGKVLAFNDTTFQCDGSINTFKVMFPEPVKLEPRFPYIASAQLNGPDSHYGSKGLQRVVFQSVGEPSVTFQFSYSGYGNNNGTSVEDGQIPELYFYTKLHSAAISIGGFNRSAGRPLLKMPPIMLVMKLLADSKQCCITTDSDENVLSLKKLVEQQLHVPAEEQKLLYKGKLLLDSQTLASNNIIDGSRIHVMVTKSSAELKLASQLRTMLRKQFNEVDSEHVLDKFFQNLNTSISSLSLDDIERIAAKNQL